MSIIIYIIYIVELIIIESSLNLSINFFNINNYIIRKIFIFYLINIYLI